MLIINTDQKKMADKKQQYLIGPKYKKSVCEEQIWKNILKSGKSVTVKVGNVYRWGEFYITINEEEKAEILKKDTVIINDYEDYEMISMWDGGCDFWLDIVDEDDYTKEELDQIKLLLYKSSNDDDDGELYEEYDEEKMFDNQWSEIECEYILTGPVELKLVDNE